MTTEMAASLSQARQRAHQVALSPGYQRFVERIYERFPERSRLPREVLDRDYFRIVDHHLAHLVPKLPGYMGPGIKRVLDFGCGSGGSTIALALTFPTLRIDGTDIDADEIAVARERAELYNVADRCDFHCVLPGRPAPFRDGLFDFCLCSSVLEYVVEAAARRFCVQEMLRLLAPQGLLLLSGPNGLYPFEVHSWWQGKPKWGWNYFPRLLNAHTVDFTAWEVKRYARPTALKLYETPVAELFKTWPTFCLTRVSGSEEKR